MSIRCAPAFVLTCWIGVACSTSGGPVPVVAAADELAQLAGEWRGYYDSPAVDRRGSTRDRYSRCRARVGFRAPVER